MDIHKNARLTPQSRALLVDRVLADGWTVAEASAAVGVSERTGWKWLARFAMKDSTGCTTARLGHPGPAGPA